VPARKQRLKVPRYIKSPKQGGLDISSLEGLVKAVVSHFGYGTSKDSPFPSKEPPPVAVRKWYEERLKLKVLGANLFEWTCPGCNQRVQVETNYLHTCLLFDYEYWGFCPRCSADEP
jgi:hypothetical protein